MTSCVINILGESFSVLSSDGFTECELSSRHQGREKYTVVLYPSIKQDFAFKCYQRDGKECLNYATASIAAAAFLVLFRGLPLDEVSFEAPDGVREVFYTGDGWFSSKTSKCKLLYTNDRFDFLGADISVSFVLTDRGQAAIVKTSDAMLFDESKLLCLATSLTPLPCAVAAASISDGRIYAKCADSVSAAALDFLGLSAAARTALLPVSRSVITDGLEVRFSGELFSVSPSIS